MPELPEVETVRRALAPVLVGRVLERLDVRRERLRFPLPGALAERLRGRRIEHLGRQGKFLLFGLSGELTLLSHLGMSGSFGIHRQNPPPPGPHDHLDMVTEQGTLIRYRDPRRFGFFDLCATCELSRHPMIAHLGPDPLSEEFDGEVLRRRLNKRTGAIKTSLLDQRLLAGLGNIYACESLFYAGISPHRKAGLLGRRRCHRLALAMVDVLRRAVAAGGASLRDHRSPEGDLGYFQHAFAVYGRAGHPCPGCDCDLARTGGIARVVQSGRATFWCSRRQR